MISSVYAKGGSAPKTEAEIKAECRRAWQVHGLVVVRPEWFNSWADRKQAEILAEKIHGRRAPK